MHDVITYMCVYLDGCTYTCTVQLKCNLMPACVTHLCNLGMHVARPLLQLRCFVFVLQYNFKKLQVHHNYADYFA